MRNTRKHKKTGLTISLKGNIEGKKKIFVDINGNHQSVIETQESAHKFAEWLQSIGHEIEHEWKHDVENG